MSASHAPSAAGLGTCPVTPALSPPVLPTRGAQCALWLRSGQRDSEVGVWHSTARGGRSVLNSAVFCSHLHPGFALLHGAAVMRADGPIVVPVGTAAPHLVDGDSGNTVFGTCSCALTAWKSPPVGSCWVRTALKELRHLVCPVAGSCSAGSHQKRNVKFLVV